MPGRKMSSVGIAGAISTLVTWILHDLIGLDLHPDIVVALTTIIGFVLGYSVPENNSESSNG